jgi:hypothetical protein
VLLRDALDAGRQRQAARLIAALAETGCWVSARSKELGRAVHLLETSWSTDEAFRRDETFHLLMRLGLTTIRHRQRTPETHWRKAGRRLLAVSADNSAAARAFRQWWDPSQHDAPLDEVRALVWATRSLAGAELSLSMPASGTADSREAILGDVDASLAWWRAQPALTVPVAPAATPTQAQSALLRIPAALIQHAEALRHAAGPPQLLSPPSPSLAATAPQRLSLHVRYAYDRYGELAVELVLFGVSEGAVRTLLTSGHYERPLSQTEEVGRLRQHLSAMRQTAARGQPIGGHLTTVQQDMAALAPTAFWNALGEWIGPHTTALELVTTDDFGVPWEHALIALPAESQRPGASAAVPLCTHVPVVRSRQRHVGGGSSRLTNPGVLLLFDPSHPGVDDEIACISKLFCDVRGSAAGLHRVGTLGEYQHMASELGSCGVVHYAGHRCVAASGAPALNLRGGTVPLHELLDGLAANPPGLLFLNACSTLTASQELRPVASGSDASADARGTHWTPGTLEPLLRSPVPAIVGTLWDVRPPGPPLFVEAFYRAWLASRDAVAALQAARIACSHSEAWKDCWPAYVILAP